MCACVCVRARVSDSEADEYSGACGMHVFCFRSVVVVVAVVGVVVVRGSSPVALPAL